jgi:hypothetical protein
MLNVRTNPQPGGGVLAECVAILRNEGSTSGLVSPVNSSSWDSSMSDAMAHLLSAHFDIEALVGHPLEPEGVAMSLELASQSVWAALVSLDECSFSLSLESPDACPPKQWSSERALASGRADEPDHQWVDRAVS